MLTKLYIVFIFDNFRESNFIFVQLSEAFFIIGQISEARIWVFFNKPVLQNCPKKYCLYLRHCTMSVVCILYKKLQLFCSCLIWIKNDTEGVYVRVRNSYQKCPSTFLAAAPQNFMTLCKFAKINP